MRYRPGNAQAQGDRDEQQDAFAFSDVDDLSFVAHGGVLAAVADGMGGLSGGRAASAGAIRAFLDAYCAKPEGEMIDAALDRALTRANEAVCDVVSPPGGADHRRGGTTLVAAVLHADGLHWVSAGDSRIYLVRGGHAEPVTLDHNYGLELDARVAAGTLSATEARMHPDRESLVSYLGDVEVPAVDRSHTPFPLRPDDLVLICSDGLYRAVDTDEMGRLATPRRDPQALCEDLVARALDKHLPHQDNCTVLAVSGRSVSGRH